MDKLHKKAEAAVEEAPQIVNEGVGSTSYQFLHSVLSDGTDNDMTRAELFRKRQRLDTLLTASAEQLKAMKVEIGELKQIIKFCEAHLFQALNEADQLLAEIESCIAFNIAKSRLCAQCKVLKKKVVLSRHSISRMSTRYQALRLSEHMAELAGLAPCQIPTI